MKTPRGLCIVVAVAVAAAAVTVALGAARAGAAPDPKSAPAEITAPSGLDIEARDLFRAQRYADALAIYQRLHAETHHPTYLRNIGRCHQMMRQPGPAIDAFRAYLRDARAFAAAERAEIEGYIGEMQRMELSAPPFATAGAPAAPAGSAPPGATAAAAAPAARPSIARRWWFWTAIGVLAATGVVVAAAASGGRDRLPCPTGAVCPP